VSASETDLGTLKALYEDWGRGDFSGHTEIFHPEMAAETFGMGEPIRAESYDGFLDTMREWLSTWERPLRIEAEDFIQAGDRILVLIHWTGRGKGSGVEIEGRGAHLWTFRDGLVARHETYRDRDQAKGRARPRVTRLTGGAGPGL
jgi:ketosteroid isomerase-like protein